MWMSMNVFSDATQLSTTRENLTAFNKQFSISAAKPLTARRLDLLATPLPDSDVYLDVGSLLSVLLCRGVVMSEHDWLVIVAELCESRVTEMGKG